MHYQYPIESLARSRAAASQLQFARQARHALFDSDETVFEPHSHGLVILAANEAALEKPARILREIYGGGVELRGAKVRLMPGDPPHEPIAHVRISTRNEFALAVLAELRMRGARVVEQCERPRIFVARAEAPMAALLGLPSRLEEIAGADVVHAIRLLGYRPIPVEMAEAQA
jgi:hypothetical protein